jgi:hypothetical protein
VRVLFFWPVEGDTCNIQQAVRDGIEDTGSEGPNTRRRLAPAEVERLDTALKHALFALYRRAL